MNKKNLLIIVLLLLATIYGCTEGNYPKPIVPPVRPNPPVTPNPAPVTPENPVVTLPAVPINTSDIVSASNQFAMDIYTAHRSDKGNMFFSPFSIGSALTIAYEGAKGQTAEQMQNVLHLPSDIDKVRTEYQQLYSDMNKNTKFQLSVANALWAQKDYLFKQEYLTTIETYYGGKAASLDFVGDTEKSRQTINQWVEEQTNNRIQELIQPGVLNALTRLVITNTIYFKANWTIKFDKELTHNQDFTIPTGRKVTTKMMTMQKYLKYGENGDMQIVELPYKGEQVSMLVLLPKSESLDRVESTISLGNLAEWKKAMETEEVRVNLPRFSFETKYELGSTLRSLGMPQAFTTDADFTGMTPRKELFISDVIHQTYINVTESGTEAAAATAVTVTGGAAPMQTEPKIFAADHPFLFMIQDKATGNILFMGRLSDPSVK